MQGTELLRDPSFAQTLEQSPFQANDLPGLSSAVANTFEKLGPEQRKELKAVLDELDDLSEQELESFLRLIGYVEQDPSQYPKLVKQLVETGAFSPEDVPQQYDPNLMAIVKTLIGQALRRVRAVSSPTFAKGGIVSLKKEASKVAAAGRGGDTILAHINPMEADMLKRMGGRGTINPKTGLPEFGFWKTVGNIFKIGAQIVGTAILTPFVGPIAAGAIVSGATALLSGAKPADALKSALIGGTLGGITAGFSGSGSFTENAFAGGSLFGSGPAASPMLDWMKSTSVGEKLFGSIPTPGGAEAAAGAAAPDAAKVAAGPGGGEVYSADPSKAVTAQAIKPTVSPSVFSSEGIKSLWSNYKVPIMLGGGALLLGMGQNKEEIKPSLVGGGKTGTDLLSEKPEAYGFNAAKFAQVYPQSPPSVFPGGGYISPTTRFAPAPTPNFGQIRYPTTGIMSAKAGGAINGPGSGTSDSIPARLSDGEFVMTAKAVRGAGKGDRMKGARKMYELMHKFERMA
jgi:hypothetical protein